MLMLPRARCLFSAAFTLLPPMSPDDADAEALLTG